jgi:hypothetical protein
LEENKPTLIRSKLALLTDRRLCTKELAASNHEKLRQRANLYVFACLCGVLAVRGMLCVALLTGPDTQFFREREREREETLSVLEDDHIVLDCTKSLVDKYKFFSFFSRHAHVTRTRAKQRQPEKIRASRSTHRLLSSGPEPQLTSQSLARDPPLGAQQWAALLRLLALCSPSWTPQMAVK